MEYPAWHGERWKWTILSAVGFLTVAVGCVLVAVLRDHQPADSASPASPQTVAAAGDKGDLLLYDAGEVVSGEVVSHAFPVRNDWDEPMEIRRPEDVQIRCGCSSVEPACRRLAPGESTTVTVTMRTLGREGVQAHGGEVTWTSTSGKQRKLVLTLKVEAHPALQVSDAILYFDDEKEPGCTAKEVTFTASKTLLDWDSLRLSIAPPFRIAKIDKGKDHVRCVVTHVGEVEQEEVSGRLMVEVQTKGAGEGRLVSASASVLWRPRQELVVRPKTVPLVFDAEGRGKARLHLRGKQMENKSNPIRVVTCEGYAMDWTLRPLSGGKAAILELQFASVAGAKIPDKPLLVVNFQDAKAVRLPVSVIARTSTSREK